MVDSNGRARPLHHALRILPVTAQHELRLMQTAQPAQLFQLLMRGLPHRHHQPLIFRPVALHQCLFLQRDMLRRMLRDERCRGAEHQYHQHRGIQYLRAEQPYLIADGYYRQRPRCRRMSQAEHQPPLLAR